MIKTTFFGTFEFADKILKTLLLDGRFEIIEVITQPDRLTGRNKSIKHEPPVKHTAKKHALPIIQPETLENFHSRPGAMVNIVAEYGKIIPRQIYAAPPFGTVNVHPSLLPKWRGASPLQSAILNGEKTSGVSIMLIDDAVDHGPLLGQLPFTILPSEKFPELRERVADIAANFLITILPNYIDKKITPIAQNDSKATYSRELKRADGHVNFFLPTTVIYNQFRAFYPWPGSYVWENKKRIKLLEISPANRQIQPGKMIFQANKIFIGTRDEAIEVSRLQPENKPAMSAKDFINGNRTLAGMILT